MMQETFQSMLDGWWREFKEDKYAPAVAGLLFVVLFVVGGFKAKRWYFERQEGAAQLVFSEALEEYDRVLFVDKKGTEEKQKWDDSTLAFKVVQDQHSGTAYAKYAEAFQADIEARKGNYSEAVSMLEQFIRKLNAKDPAYYLFKTKVALLKLDAGKTPEALTELSALESNQDNPNSDTAAFYLGYHYWANDQIKKAKSYWSRFEKDKQPKDREKVSPWSTIVQIKLAQIA